MKQKVKLTKSIVPVLSWIHSLLLVEGVYLVIAGTLGMDGMDGSRYPLQGLLLILPIVASYLCMRKIDSLWLYLLIGAAMTAVMWKVTGLPFTGIVTAAIFLIRCYARTVRGGIRRQAREMPGGADALSIPELEEIHTFLDSPRVWYWFVFGIFYIIIIATGRTEYLKPMFWVLVLEIFVCFAYCYLENQHAYIETNQKIPNLPAQAIRRVGRAVLLVMIALLAVFVLPSVIYNQEPLANIRPVEVEHVSQTTGGQSDRMEMILQKIRDEEKPAPPWLTGVLRGLGILLEVAAVLVVIFLVFRFVRYLMRSYGEQEEDEIIDLGKDRAEAVSRVKGNRRRKEEGFWSPNQKIRRIYKKTIEKRIKQKPRGSETPEELEQAADLAETDEQFHRLYEKARYSEKGCSAEEASGYQK